jgi:hypothetical protein
VDPREKRLAQNEALYREVNERVAEVAESHLLDSGEQLYRYFCECSNADCTLQIWLTLGEYEDVRRDPRRFFVAVGHELPEIEVVLERGERFWIIEKRGEAGEYVEERDPRDSDRASDGSV